MEEIIIDNNNNNKIWDKCYFYAGTLVILLVIGTFIGILVYLIIQTL